MLVVLRFACSNLLRGTSAKYVVAFSPSFRQDSLPEKHNSKISAKKRSLVAAMSSIVLEFEFIL